MIKAIEDRETLINFLENYDNHSWAGLTLTTEDTGLRKTSKLDRKIKFEQEVGVAYDNVRKHSIFTAGLGFSYLSLLKTRLEREGKTLAAYTPGDPDKIWHQPYKETKTIREHKRTGELYANVYLIANNYPTVTYFDISTGKDIPKEKLANFMPEDPDYSNNNQGLESDNVVKVRIIKFKSINEIRIDHDVIRVRVND